MNKYIVLLGHFEKQVKLIRHLFDGVKDIDVSEYDKGYVFALKTQQLYTAIEDLFKQIAKSFENHIDDLGSFHKEILLRMQTEIPNVRPEVISKSSFILLDKVRAFRHFIRHAYDCELEEGELRLIQDKLKQGFSHILSEVDEFKKYVKELADSI